MESNVGKRTGIDFSEHVISETIHKDIRITRFKRPDTNHYAITFINTCGVMSVTGDLGNWIFCREFHPSKEGFVSDQYWDEKLQIASVQKSHDYNEQETIDQIAQWEEEFDDMSEEEKDYIDDLKRCAGDEIDYIYQAYREHPSSIDPEQIPLGKVRKGQLKAVYDAFDAICKRIT